MKQHKDLHQEFYKDFPEYKEMFTQATMMDKRFYSECRTAYIHWTDTLGGALANFRLHYKDLHNAMVENCKIK